MADPEQDDEPIPASTETKEALTASGGYRKSADILVTAPIAAVTEPTPMPTNMAPAPPTASAAPQEPAAESSPPRE